VGQTLKSRARNWSRPSPVISSKPCSGHPHPVDAGVAAQAGAWAGGQRLVDLVFDHVREPAGRQDDRHVEGGGSGCLCNPAGVAARALRRRRPPPAAAVRLPGLDTAVRRRPRRHEQLARRRRQRARGPAEPISREELGGHRPGRATGRRRSRRRPGAACPAGHHRDVPRLGRPGARGHRRHDRVRRPRLGAGGPRRPSRQRRRRRVPWAGRLGQWGPRHGR
jgi:hypothetical protein